MFNPPCTCDLRAALDPAIQDPNNAATLAQLSAIDRLGALAIYLRSEKREKSWFKIPIHNDCVDDERGCDACVRAMVSICSMPNDLTGDNKLERLCENWLR